MLKFPVKDRSQATNRQTAHGLNVVVCVLILFQNSSSQHRSRLFSRYKAVSITDKQTIHKTDNPRSKKKKGGKQKCRHQSLSKAIIIGYTHYALSVCLSVCLCLCLCVSLSHPTPHPHLPTAKAVL